MVVPVWLDLYQQVDWGTWLFWPFSPFYRMSCPQIMTMMLVMIVASDGGSNDDGADHSLLLLVGVAGRDGPALTFAALRLHIHLQLIVILMISWFSWWYVAILIIFLTMMRHFLDYLFNDDTSLSWLSFWRWCDTHHRLLGNSCVPHFHISLPAAAHLPQNIFSKLGRIASDMVKS